MFAFGASARPTVEHQVVPHTTDRARLEREAAIYRQNWTPITRPDGSLTAGESRPGSASLAGAHLGEVQARFGESGLARSVAGLTVTRGHSFAAMAVRAAPAAVQARAARVETGPDESGEPAAAAVPQSGSTAPAARATAPAAGGRGEVGAAAVRGAGRAIERAGAGEPLGEPYRARLSALTGDPLADVRLHDSPASHEAARQLDARAFTLGRSIYLGAGENRPATDGGFRLLAHEAAHAVQQRGAVVAPLARASDVGAADTPHEREAERFADAAARGGPVGAGLSAGSVRAARAMRVIGFTGTAGAPAKVNPTAAEDATGTALQIAAGTPPGPYFNWSGTYTITGDAGDPFANFAIFPVQVCREQWEHVFWGTGADRTTRRRKIPSPARDSTAGSIHYHDPLGSAAFAAAGDARTSNLNDTPGVNAIGTPFANPVPPRGGTRGWFNWGMAFVAYLGARDSTVAGAAGFRPLNFCYWNLSVDGNWDTARPAGARVSASGVTNVGPVSVGGAAEFPPMFGGTDTNTLLNDPANLTTT